MADQPSLTQLNQQAIDEALKGNWEQALEINKLICEQSPESTDCLNRIAKAYMELGKYSQAKKTYQEVLDIDQYNSIAQKNLKKISSIKKEGDGVKNGHSPMLSPSLFLEEPGVTTSVNLIKVAEPQKLIMISSGAEASLVQKGHGISVTTISGQYLGVLPDDVGFHLRRMIAGGNKYQALIKSIKSNGVTIFIREIVRSKKFKNQASFLDSSKVVSYSSEHIPLMGEEPVEEDDEQNQEDLPV